MAVEEYAVGPPWVWLGGGTCCMCGGRNGDEGCIIIIMKAWVGGEGWFVTYYSRRY